MSKVCETKEYKELEKQLEELIIQQKEIHDKITCIMDKMQDLITKSENEKEDTKEITTDKKIDKDDKIEKKDLVLDKEVVKKPTTKRKVQRKTIKSKVEEKKD